MWVSLQQCQGTEGTTSPACHAQGFPLLAHGPGPHISFPKDISPFPTDATAGSGSRSSQPCPAMGPTELGQCVDPGPSLASSPGRCQMPWCPPACPGCQALPCCLHGEAPALTVPCNQTATSLPKESTQTVP